MHLHDALGLGHELLGVRAVAPVHRHAAAARDEADDVVARHGVAAAGQAHKRTFHAFHHHAVGAFRLVLLRLVHQREHWRQLAGGHGRRAQVQRVGLLIALAAQLGEQAIRHALHALLAGADADQHVVGVLVSHVVGDGAQRALGAGVGDAQAVLAHLARQLVAAAEQVVCTGDLAEVRADLVARAGGFHDVEPVAAGACRLLRENLHAVAQLQLVGQRHNGAVDLRAHAVVAHLGVDGIGEVDGRGSGAQAHGLALRREHEHLGRRQVHLQVLQELARIVRLVLPVHHLAQPCQLLVHGVVAAAAALLLVAPVRRHAVLALAVHLLGADLHLQRPAGGADDRGVQALVHVELRHGDVVFEPPGHGVPQRMHRAQRRVAVLHRLDDDAHGDQVVDLGEALALLRHLLIDAVQVLRAAHDLRLDAHLVHLAAQHGNDLVKVLLALEAAFGDHTRDLLELVGLKVIEAQVLELPFDGVDTQAVRDGRVDLKRLARLEDATILLERRQGAHVVQAVGQLDDDDADVLAHGNEHLADSGRLLVGEGFHLNARDLGDAVDQLRHVRAELLLDQLAGHVGVLHRVVQKRRAQRFHVHAQIGQDDGHLHRMRDERLARLAARALVSAGGEAEGLLELGLLLVGQVAARHVLQVGEALIGGFLALGHHLRGLGGKRLLRHVRAAQQAIVDGLPHHVGLRPQQVLVRSAIRLVHFQPPLQRRWWAGWDATRASAGQRRCCA